MEIDKLKRLIRLQQEHMIIQEHIYELEDVIRANERNLGKGNFEAKDFYEKIIKSYESKRTDNNLERYNLAYGRIH